MTDDSTGPWVLALGTLAVGAAAMAQLWRRRATTEDVEDESVSDDASPQS